MKNAAISALLETHQFQNQNDPALFCFVLSLGTWFFSIKTFKALFFSGIVSLPHSPSKFLQRGTKFLRFACSECGVKVVLRGDNALHTFFYASLKSVWPLDKNFLRIDTLLEKIKKGIHVALKVFHVSFQKFLTIASFAATFSTSSGNASVSSYLSM